MSDYWSKLVEKAFILMTIAQVFLITRYYISFTRFNNREKCFSQSATSTKYIFDTLKIYYSTLNPTPNLN